MQVSEGECRLREKLWNAIICSRFSLKAQKEEVRMRRVVSGLLAILVTLLVLCSAATASSVYKVTISIHFDSNLFFSRYDVDMYINDLELERLPHGKDYLGSFYAEEGPNILYFYKHDNKSVNGAIKFNVEGDTTIACSLHCYNNEVELKVVNLSVVDASSVTKTMPEENKSQETPVTTEEPIKEKIELTEVPTQVISPEPTEDLTSEPEAITSPEPEPVTFSDINLQEMSDEELEEAAAAIKAEQRARIKTKIVLDTTNLTLNLGKTQKIEAHIDELPPEEQNMPKLEWKSSDNKIATCKNGTIKAVSGGKATITCFATLSDGTYISQDCLVNVHVLAASLTSDIKKLELKVNEKYTPSYTIKPNTVTSRELVFSTSDKEVATVNSSGEITAEWIGKAKITATTTDGSNKSYSIDVKVTYDAFMHESNGKQIFNAVCNKGKTVTNRSEAGDDEWFNRMADVDGLSFEVDSAGEYGPAVVIQVMDLMRTGKKEVFFRVLDNVFIGDDLKTATNWVKNNLGREATKKIGDTNIVLSLTVMKAPIMYLVDDEHLDWI